jgi:hypothetical protein
MDNGLLFALEGISHLDMVGERIWGEKVAEKEPMVFPSTRRLEARRYRLKPLFLLYTDSMVPSSLAAPMIEGGQSSYVSSSRLFRAKSAEKDPLTL